MNNEQKQLLKLSFLYKKRYQTGRNYIHEATIEEVLEKQHGLTEKYKNQQQYGKEKKLNSIFNKTSTWYQNNVRN